MQWKQEISLFISNKTWCLQYPQSKIQVCYTQVAEHSLQQSASIWDEELAEFSVNTELESACG